MFAQTRSSLYGVFRLPLARTAASYRLDKASRKVTISCIKHTSSNKTLLLAAAAAAAAAATATIVPSLCDEDRLERWNDRWATGRVVRPLVGGHQMRHIFDTPVYGYLQQQGT